MTKPFAPATALYFVESRIDVRNSGLSPTAREPARNRGGSGGEKDKVNARTLPYRTSSISARPLSIATLISAGHCRRGKETARLHDRRFHRRAESSAPLADRGRNTVVPATSYSTQRPSAAFRKRVGERFSISAAPRAAGSKASTCWRTLTVVG